MNGKVATTLTMFHENSKLNPIMRLHLCGANHIISDFNTEKETESITAKMFP